MSDYEYEETISALPSSIDAERTILGAVLLNSEIPDDLETKLQADDFSLDSHRCIFLRMAELHRERSTIDIITLSERLAKHKEVEKVGGVAYLASLTEGLPLRPVIEEYVRIVKDKCRLRRVMAISSAAIQRAANQSESALDIISAVQNQLGEIENASEESSDLESIGQWLNQHDIFEQRDPGISTGFEKYDELTYGLHGGELTVIAARTSMGKTSHASCLAWMLAKRGKNVAVFLNEQQKASFIGRLLCSRASVSYSAYRSQTMGDFEHHYIQQAIDEFKQWPIFWDMRPRMSIASIKSKTRRLYRGGDLDVILVDQLSGISSDGVAVKGMQTPEIIGAKVYELKALSLELNVPIILYHQLNRDTDKSEDKRPTLANLRESGKIEEHADNVAFLYRPHYYDRKNDAIKYDGEIILAKQREGPVGTAECEFIPEICRWQNKEKREAA